MSTNSEGVGSTGWHCPCCCSEGAEPLTSARRLAWKRTQAGPGEPQHSQAAPGPPPAAQWGTLPPPGGGGAALRVSALRVECVADRMGKRINMKAENGIRRPRDNVLTPPPPSMTTASCFHFMASESRAEHGRLGLPLLPRAGQGAGGSVANSEQETPQSARKRGGDATLSPLILRAAV